MTLESEMATALKLNRNGGAKQDVALPDDRRQAVEYGLSQFQVMATERDNALRELHERRADIAGYKVALEANASRIAQLESYMAENVAQRDRAVADSIKWEALFVSLQAQMRAFKVPSAPLITAGENDGAGS